MNAPLLQLEWGTFDDMLGLFQSRAFADIKHMVLKYSIYSDEKLQRLGAAGFEPFQSCGFCSHMCDEGKIEDFGFELNMLAGLALLFPLVRYNSPQRRRERVWRCLGSQQTSHAPVALTGDKTQPLILQSTGRVPSGVSWRPQARACCP
jgi:hypothetical protein